jgi:hypothetical protein
MSVKKIFPAAWAAYRKNLKTVAWVCLCVYGPVVAIQQFIPTLSLADLMWPENYNFSAVTRLLLIALCISVVFEPLAEAAVTAVAARHAQGAKVTMPEILDASLAKGHLLAVTAFLNTLLVGALFFLALLLASAFPPAILLFAVGIHTAVAYRFYNQVVALNGPWGLGALRESRRRVRGNWWRVALFSLFTSCLIFLLELLLMENALLLSEAFFGASPVLYLSATVAAQFLGFFFGCFFKFCTAFFYFGLSPSKHTPEGDPPHVDDPA